MTPEEERIKQIKNNIADAKKDLKASSQIGPVIVAAAGILIMLISLVNISGFGLGLLVIMFAIVWSYSKSNDARKLKEEISRYENQLYTIEKKAMKP